MIVYTASGDLAKVREAINAGGLSVTSAELGYVPKNAVPITDDEISAKVLRVLDALDDLDDVTNVHTNADIQID